MKPNDYRNIQLSDSLTLEKVSALREALGYFYKEDTPGDVYKAKDFTDPVTKLHFNNVTEFADYMYSDKVGFPKGTSVKNMGIGLESLYENLSKIPKYADSNFSGAPEPPVQANIINKDSLEQLEVQAEQREQSKKTADEKSKADVKRFIERYQGKVILTRPAKELPTITLSAEDKNTLYSLGKASSLDSATAFEEYRQIIKSALPKDSETDIPQELIDNTAYEVVERTKPYYENFKDPNEIPTTAVHATIIDPLTALQNPQELVKHGFSAEDSKRIAGYDQILETTLAYKNDGNSTLASPIFGGAVSVSQSVFPSVITQYEISSDQKDAENGVEVKLGELLEQARQIEEVFAQYSKTQTQTVGYSSGYTAPAYFKSDDPEKTQEVKNIIKKTKTGEMFGFKNQGEYAKHVAQLEAIRKEKISIQYPDQELSQTVYTNIPYEESEKYVENEEEESESRSFEPLSSDTQRLYRALRKRAAQNTVTPVTALTTAAAGTTVGSLSSLLVSSGSTLLLPATVSGALSTGGFQTLTLASLATQGQLIYHAGIGKYTFSIIGLSKGSTEMYAVGVKLGSKSFGLGITKVGGKIVAAGTITTNAAGQLVGKALPSLLSKLLIWFGTLSAPVTGFLSLIAGSVLGKVIEKIPWHKIKEGINNAKEVLFFGGAAAAMLVPGIAGVAIGIPMMIAGGAAGLSAGGFSIASGLTSIAKLIGAVGAVTLGAIGAPLLAILIGFPVIIALILFIINSGAYVVPPSLTTLENIVSPYIGIEKTANPAGPFENTELPLTITYTVTITAKQETLTNIVINDECMIINEAGQSPCPSDNTGPPSQISVGTPFTYTYTVTYSGNGYIDSLVIDTITVTADTQASGSQSTNASASITIGDPPTDCLQIDGPWPSAYRANLESAIGTLVSKYGNYVSKVCSAYPNGLPLRFSAGGSASFWGWNHNDYIDFFPLGVKNSADALYTLAHELGHSLAWRVSGIESGYISTPGIRTEAPYCFYTATINFNPGESLQEAIALHVIAPRCGGVQTKYPIHYRYIINNVFN